MVKERLSVALRRELEESLESCWPDLANPADLMLNRSMLGDAVGDMQVLGLQSWHGRSYQMWKQLSDYISRVGFTRRLGVTLYDIQNEVVVGVDNGLSPRASASDLPLRPDGLNLLLSLENSVRRQELTCSISLRSQGRGYLTHDELRLSLDGRPGRSFIGSAYIRLHFTGRSKAAPDRPDPCRVTDCISHRRIGDAAEVERAYEANGLTGIWHTLDRFWSDSLAWRPLHRPLSPSALAVRRLIHHGSVVKVLTSSGPVIGRLTGGNTDMQSTRYVLLDLVVSSGQPPSDHPRTILATDILDILPWRLKD